VIALIILAIAAVLLSAGAYYLLKGTGKLPAGVTETKPLEFVQKEALPISSSDEIGDIEKELDGTIVGTVDQDLNELDTEASGL